MRENSDLCVILEMIRNRFHVRSLGLSLRNNNTVIETYLSSLVERLLGIGISSKRFNGLTRKI